MPEEIKGAPPMPDRFHRELANLKARLLELAQAAEAAIELSIKALLHRDHNLAIQVITGDRAVNSLEEAIDNECIRLIALFQPVAIDLRQLMAVDHISAELERIGDIATNIAEEVLNLQHLPAKRIHSGLVRMAQDVQEMMRRCLQAFLTQDARLAREVCQADDEVDSLDRSIIHNLLMEMTVAHEAITAGMCQVSIVRNLERVGDHATNIAEQVVYMVEGESIRHLCQG